VATTLSAKVKAAACFGEFDLASRACSISASDKPVNLPIAHKLCTKRVLKREGLLWMTAASGSARWKDPLHIMARPSLVKDRE
jgi:hypothetical protein